MTGSFVRASSSTAITAMRASPPVALGILSVAGTATAMYGMWLFTTRGVKCAREKTRNADGSETEREIEYYGPEGPLRAVVGAVVDLLTGGSGGSASASANGH